MDEQRAIRTSPGGDPAAMAATIGAARSVIAKPFDADRLAVNCHHNYVEKEHHFDANVWVTRKGAIRAREGDLGIIPGSMGARSFIVEGKGGHQRQIPISARWFATVGNYLRLERPTEAETDRVFVVLKGQRRGRPLSDEGLGQIFKSVRERSGVRRRITCHELRHTCFTRLREAGMLLSFAFAGYFLPGTNENHRTSPRVRE